MQACLTPSELTELTPFLTGRDLAELNSLLEASPPIWTPQAGPQTAALESKADILGFGGQAGGGKSDLAVGVTVTQHFRAQIFRRYYADLKDIVRRAKEVTEGYRTGFNGSDFTVTLPGGRTLEFGAMARPDDWQRFKGRAKDAMVFDEATEFLESQIRSVIAWVRSTRPGQRRRVLFTFNPPTDENGEWVTRFFAPWLDETHPNPAAPGELRWYAMLDGEEREVPSGEPFAHVTPAGEPETVTPLSRTFIPARLSDNRFLDADGEYRRMLQNTPEPLRSQLLYGKFSGQKAVNPWQILPTAWVQAAMLRGRQCPAPPGPLSCLGMDVAHGGADKTVIAARHGHWVGPLVKAPGSATPEGRDAAALAAPLLAPSAFVNVDAIGYGASAHESLKNDWGAAAYAVNVGSSDSDRRVRYADKSGKFVMRNRRAEMYWRLREALDPENGHDFCLPDDRELLSDLCAATYKVTPSGLQVEAKDNIKARLGRSPDCADAVALTMLEEPPPATLQEWFVA